MNADQKNYEYGFFSRIESLSDFEYIYQSVRLVTAPLTFRKRFFNIWNKKSWKQQHLCPKFLLYLPQKCLHCDIGHIFANTSHQWGEQISDIEPCSNNTFTTFKEFTLPLASFFSKLKDGRGSYPKRIFYVWPKS